MPLCHQRTNVSGQERHTESVVAIRHVPARDPNVNHALKAASAREGKCWIRTENASTLLAADVLTEESNTR